MLTLKNKCKCVECFVGSVVPHSRFPSLCAPQRLWFGTGHGPSSSLLLADLIPRGREVAEVGAQRSWRLAAGRSLASPSFMLSRCRISSRLSSPFSLPSPSPPNLLCISPRGGPGNGQ